VADPAPGLVDRRVGQLHLAFPEARRYLKPGKRTEVFHHGNPIRPPDFSVDRTAARAKFGLGGGTVGLVVGGSQGARAVNEALLADLRGVVEGRMQPAPDFEILWATGTGNFERVQTALADLGNPGWVKALPYIEDMPSALASADFAISRAGAMSSAELCAWGVPMILVPLPTAAANHQYHNAVALAEAGAAVMVEEKELGGGRLWREMMTVVNDPVKRAWTEWKLPGNARAYSVWVDPDDHVWLSDWTTNSIVEFDPATAKFTSYPSDREGANVRQMLGRAGEAWGAESGTDRLVRIVTR
jgi:UDP-N-acetylglucosamine--N-acetylmuramyl-(pentapeptide) pyrophosphoryl-undecaprenol N-acetylglucosamine transferase